MLEKILDLTNLEQAYLQLNSNLLVAGKAGRYQGWDSQKLLNLETHSVDVLRRVQQELVELTPLSPAVLTQIPKKSNPQKFREIYIYNLNDRLKAQAIYQIVEPYFNEYFSPWLFSYRSSHSSYYAARSSVRHYLKYYQRDWVFTTDLKDYSSYIRFDLLKDKLVKVGLPQEVNKLLYLFIGNRFLKNGQIVQADYGLIQGVPLIALFNNLYLDDLDKQIGPRVDFYRRVGDDFLMFDQKQVRLDQALVYFTQAAKDLGLIVNQEKSQLIKAHQEFNFLGYNFSGGQVRLTSNFCQQKIASWKQRFNYYRQKSARQKINFLEKKIKFSRHNLFEEFKQIAEQKKLVTDEEQIRRLSEAFFRILTGYFFGTYSPRHRRLLQAKLKNLGLLSLYKHFSNIRYAPRKTTN